MSSKKFHNQTEFRYKSIMIKSKKNNTYRLSQTSFDNGTYRITKPGMYILTENIKFNPNPDNNNKVDDLQTIRIYQEVFLFAR